MNNDIFSMDLTRTLPPVLKKDKTMRALSQVIAGELQENARMICNNIIYARIDELPEKLLDILAYDLHIDWYDCDYPIDIKRELIKNSVEVHRKTGTVYAVETALNIVYPGTRMEEWFQYGGNPFCFRIVIDLNKIKIKADMKKIIKNINLYKRLTAHLESVLLRRDEYALIFLGHTRGILLKKDVGIEKNNEFLSKTKQVYVSVAMVKRISITYQ